MKRGADDTKPAAGRNWTQKAQDRDVWKRPISSSGETTVYEEEGGCIE